MLTAFSKTKSALLALFLSFYTLSVFALAYPEVFFYYISRGIFTPFFITDSNVLAARYFLGVLFFLYIYFLPIAFFFFLFCILPSCSRSTYSIRLRCGAVILYFHFIIVFFNHLDLSDFTCNPVNWVFSNNRGVDFASFTSQYRGTYWDSFSVVFFYFVISVILSEKSGWLMRITYDFSYLERSFRGASLPYFWSVIRVTWIIRVTVLSFIFYFFCGEGIFSDSLVLLATAALTEFTLFTLRWLFILHSMPAYGIKE